MNFPGFTAEGSLYKGYVSYRATVADAVQGELIQPAGPFSDLIDKDRPVLSRNLIGKYVAYMCPWFYSCKWEEIAYDPHRKKSYVVWVCIWKRAC